MHMYLYVALSCGRLSAQCWEDVQGRGVRAAASEHVEKQLDKLLAFLMPRERVRSCVICCG